MFPVVCSDESGTYIPHLFSAACGGIQENGKYEGVKIKLGPFFMCMLSSSLPMVR